MLEVRRLRQEKDWNQTELAFHAGLAPSVISEIENGKRDPSARTLRKLADALKVDVADLFPKGQAPLPDLEDERRSSLQSWIRFVGRLADRWEAEIDTREHEWQVAAPPIRRNVKRVPNLQWANEIRSTALDVMAATNEELEMALGVATSAEAMELFCAARRLDDVISRTEAWYSSKDGSLDTAKVINLRDHMERMQRRIGVRAS